MGHRLDNRLDKLEERQTDDVGREEEIARWRAKQERIQERAKEDPEGLRALLDALDDFLDAEEKARRRSETTGEDPEDAPEVWEATRAYEQIERRLLGETTTKGGGIEPTKQQITAGTRGKKAHEARR